MIALSSFLRIEGSITISCISRYTTNRQNGRQILSYILTHSITATLFDQLGRKASLSLGTRLRSHQQRVSRFPHRSERTDQGEHRKGPLGVLSAAFAIIEASSILFDVSGHIPTIGKLSGRRSPIQALRYHSIRHLDLLIGIEIGLVRAR